MNAPTEQKPDGCLDECYKNNLRIRLFEFKTNDRDVSYLIEISAWNSWAGQAKIIDAWGGLEFEAGRWAIDTFTTLFSHYDWVKGEIVMEPNAEFRYE